MIEAIDLTVRRRGRTLLDAVSFDVRPGQVTGVLGGTGAGKTVLVRRMVHLERGGGETLFDGRPYRSLRHPMREVGLLLDPGAGHPDRTVRGQLLLALATDRRAARDAGSVNGSVVSRSAGSRRTDGRKAAVGVSAGAAVSAAVGVGAGARAGNTGGPGVALDDREAGHLDTGYLDNAHRDDPYGGNADHDHGRRPGLSGRFARDRSEKAGGARRAASAGDVDLEPSRKGRPADRIEAVLDIVGLTEQSRTRLADLTDGMATRLGIAVALLGDPKALVLDSPERGLEPEGLDWLGALLRAFTAQGRAALVTGSDTETMVGMADRLLLLDHGYLVGTRTAEEVLRAPSGAAVIVRSPQIVRLASILAEAGARTTQGESTSLEVRGLDRARVGDLAFRNGIPVHELSEQFTGSDPGDLVLAACSGRHRPIVPIQGFPDTAANAMRPLTTSRRRRDNDVVRVTMSPDEDLFGSVRLLTPVPASAPGRAEPDDGPDTELMPPVAVDRGAIDHGAMEQAAADRAPADQRSNTSTASLSNAAAEAGPEASAEADAGTERESLTRAKSRDGSRAEAVGETTEVSAATDANGRVGASAITDPGSSAVARSGTSAGAAAGPNAVDRGPSTATDPAVRGGTDIGAGVVAGSGKAAASVPATSARAGAGAVTSPAASAAADPVAAGASAVVHLGSSSVADLGSGTATRSTTSASAGTELSTADGAGTSVGSDVSASTSERADMSPSAVAKSGVSDTEAAARSATGGETDRAVEGDTPDAAAGTTPGTTPDVTPRVTPDGTTAGPTASGPSAGTTVGNRIAAGAETGADMEGDK